MANDPPQALLLAQLSFDSTKQHAMDNRDKGLHPSRHRHGHFMTDTERIIHRHLANKDDIITEEDIRNVRIGVTPNESGADYPQMQEEENGRNDRASNSPDVNKERPEQREGRADQLPK